MFSSAVHGDPSTPIFRAYQGDPVMFRFMGGAHEEGHNFTLCRAPLAARARRPELQPLRLAVRDDRGVLQLRGQRDPDGQEGQQEPGGRAGARGRARPTTAPDLVLPGGAGAPGDYLYSSQPLNDLWMGMWGIFRVPAKRVRRPAAAPEQHRAAAGAPGQEWPALRPGGAARRPPTAPKPCPTATAAAHLQHQPRQARRSSTTRPATTTPTASCTC